ncbi:hypothetical protein [Limosilactobacillus albertensis]|nr:hypothetical protein [Limosilactobacillus albertensis]
MLLDTFTVHDSHVKQQFNSTHNTGDTQKSRHRITAVWPMC